MCEFILISQIEKFINNHLLVVNMVEAQDKSGDEQKPNAFEIYNEVNSSFSRLERAIGAHSEAKKAEEKEQLENQVYQTLLGEGYLQDKLPESINPVDWAKGLISIIGGGKLSRSLELLVDTILTDGVEIDSSDPSSMTLYNSLVALEDLARSFGIKKLDFVKQYREIIEKLEDENKSVSQDEVKDYVEYYVDKYIISTIKENELADEKDIDNLRKFYIATYLEDSDARKIVVKRAIKGMLIDNIEKNKEELYKVSEEIAKKYDEVVKKYLTHPGSLKPEEAYKSYIKLKAAYETLENLKSNGNNKLDLGSLIQVGKALGLA